MMRMKLLIGAAFLAGLLFLGLVLVGQHLWIDHQNFHALLNIEAQRQAQQRMEQQREQAARGKGN